MLWAQLLIFTEILYSNVTSRIPNKLRTRFNPMRILHTLNHVGETGNGIVNVAVDLACLQAAAGQDVLVCSAGGSFTELLRQYNVQHVLLEEWKNPADLIRAAGAFHREVRRFRPDIVHAHMMTGTVLAKVVGMKSKYRLVTHVHNEFQRSAILMGLGDRVIAVSTAVATSMEKRGVPKRKIRVVPNSTVGSPRHQSLSAYRAADLKRPAIVTVAGMYQRKGIMDLLEAFDVVAARIPNAHLYLVGDGHDRSLFEERAQRSQHRGQIHFEGFQKTPQPYLLAADIFVLASHRDPYPLVIIEAREAGCAIIASDVDGIPEALDNGAAGILVPPRDPKALEEKIVELLLNPDKLQAWKINARANVEDFTLRHVVDEVDQVYRELVPSLPLGAKP